jgi:hypothetical protein
MPGVGAPSSTPRARSKSDGHCSSGTSAQGSVLEFICCWRWNPRAQSEAARQRTRSHLHGYAPRSVERLRQLFPEARVVAHALKREQPTADLQLLHRVDTELSNREWKAVLPRFRQPILFVPPVLLDSRIVLRELARPMLKRRAIRAGYCRNENAFRHLWRIVPS